MQRRKILVADDSDLFRDLESLFLARAGSVITAENGGQALELLRLHRPAVAVLDLDMPGLSGDQVCREVRADPEICETPLVLVIGAAEPAERERAVRAGADDVIAKPVNRIALLQAVNRLLRSRRPGLARVPLETAVQMRSPCGRVFGMARNLSRGGMFVQAAEPPPASTELEVRFSLPDSKSELSPTAVVVWRRDPAQGAAPGVGLQFLRLDREGAARIDDFVYQNSSGLWGDSAPEG